jgi:hypothetical protein
VRHEKGGGQVAESGGSRRGGRVRNKGGRGAKRFDISHRIHAVGQFENIFGLEVRLGLRFWLRKLVFGLDLRFRLSGARGWRGVLFPDFLRLLDIIFRDDAADGGKDLLHCRFFLRLVGHPPPRFGKGPASGGG